MMILVQLDLISPSDEQLEGIGDYHTGILGIVNLKISLLNIQLDREVPFAVVKDENLPCCSILGANVFKENKIIIDFDQRMVYCENEEEEELVYPMKDKLDMEHDYVTGFLGMIATRDKSEDESNEESRSDHQET